MGNQNLIQAIAGTQKVEFNNLFKAVSANDVQGKPTRYMCGGVTDTSKRNSDDDIKKKCYFFVDIDIRQTRYDRDGVVLADKELDEEIAQLLLALFATDFGGFQYAVNSGNGLHLYYIGDEREFDKTTYSKGVQYAYSLINTILAPLGYICDSACHNIARISRVPGSVNVRRKERGGKLLWDMGDYTCQVILEQEGDKKIFNNLNTYAINYDIEEQIKKEIEIQSKTKPIDSNDIRKDINNLDILPIVMDTWGLTGYNERGDIISLRDTKRNIGAYVYKPHNCVVTTGTTRAKTNRQTYTAYEFVLYEICNGDAKATREYFEKKGIKFTNEKKTYLDIVIPEKTYFTQQGYKYGGEIFDQEFENLRSGELCVIASPTNMGKSTFAQKTLERNADKKSLFINFEFDVDTMYEDAWKRKMGFKTKQKGTDLEPYTELERATMRAYVEACKKKIEIINLQQGEKLETVVNLILEYIEKGYSLFAIDTFSSIEGADKRETQNMIIRKLHELTKKTGCCILAIHHFNKGGQKISGSQKIADLANVVITIEYQDLGGRGGSTFTLLKDKSIYGTKTVDCYFEKGEYLSSKYM